MIKAYVFLKSDITMMTLFTAGKFREWSSSEFSEIQLREGILN